MHPSARRAHLKTRDPPQDDAGPCRIRQTAGGAVGPPAVQVEAATRVWTARYAFGPLVGLRVRISNSVSARALECPVMKRLVVAALCGVLVSWMGVGTAPGAGKIGTRCPRAARSPRGTSPAPRPPRPRNLGRGTARSAPPTACRRAGSSRRRTTTITSTRVYKGKKMRGAPVRDTTSTVAVDGPATCVANP